MSSNSDVDALKISDDSADLSSVAGFRGMAAIRSLRRYSHCTRQSGSYGSRVRIPQSGKQSFRKSEFSLSYCSSSVFLHKTAYGQSSSCQSVLARDRHFSHCPLMISGQPLFAYSSNFLPIRALPPAKTPPHRCWILPPAPVPLRH